VENLDKRLDGTSGEEIKGKSFQIELLEKFFDEKALRKFARGNLRANFVVFCIF
jgi:hypothetical protein